MNRKGKKSPLTRGKGNQRRKTNPKSRNGSTSKRDSVGVHQLGKPTQKKTSAKTKTLGERSSRFKQSLSNKKNSPAKSISSSQSDSNQSIKSKSSLWLAAYAITITVGLSTIFGTLISLAGTPQTTAPENTSVPTAVKSNPAKKAQLDNLFAITSLGKEISTLKSNLQQLAGKYPDLDPKIFLVDLDTKGFVNINSKEVVAAASTIKLPVLVAFFQEVDRGKINLEEQLVMTKDVIAGGSGGMQYEKPGSKFSALKTASQMMSVSDNTATNMLIKRMGGMVRLNQQFIKMGAKSTRLRNLLPDLTGTNTTTPEDLGNLLVKIDNGNLISLRSRDRLLYIMRKIARNTLLPVGLESGAIIAHKTGDIKPVLGDVGIIDMPSGKRYIASILVKRPDNSPKAKEFIQKASRLTYQYFKNPQTTSFTLEEDE